MILWGYITAFLYALVCVFAGVLLNKLGVSKKYTRKIVHISVGAEWFVLYHFMGNTPHFFVVCLLCFCMLLIEYVMRLVPAIRSDADNAPGTVYYGAAMSIMAAVSLALPKMLLPFGIGVIVTSLGDGVAGVVGQAVSSKNPKIYRNKTLLGSLSLALVSFVGILLFRYAYRLPITVWQILIIAIFAVLVELISVRGLDNIALTVGASALAYFLMYCDAGINYIVPIILTPLVIAIVSSKRILTVGGVVLAVALDVAVSAAFGNAGFVILLAFLSLSAVADRIKSARTGTDDSRRSVRGVRQVIANGAVAFTCALLFIFTKNDLFTVMYVAAVGEAFADTVASGFGILAKSTYDPFRLKKCEKGISGGMSLIGTVSALAASAVICLLAAAFGMIGARAFVIALLSAFLGMVFDSALGSLFQVKYRCSECGKITERYEHCGHPTIKHRGIGFINNDVVNVMANAFSAIVVLAVWL